MSFEQATRAALKARPRSLTYQVLAKDTGLSKKWLEAFAGDTYADYGVRKVQLLADRLDASATEADRPE